MSKLLELSAADWSAPNHDVRVGDVCLAALLPITEHPPLEVPGPPRAFLLDAYCGYALVTTPA